MGSQAFTKNHRDHSNDTGFQFEFFCDKCGNGYRSSFKHNAIGVGAAVLRAAGAIFGGAAYRAGWGAEHVKDAFRGPAWDKAFQEAINECRARFRQCTLCGKWVCPEVCWNHARSLCEDCAPNPHEHAPMVQAQAAVEQMREQVRNHDQLAGMDLGGRPLSAPAVLHCVTCQSPLATDARFCASCGTQVPAVADSAAQARRFCETCGNRLDPSARFCAGCGRPAA